MEKNLEKIKNLFAEFGFISDALMALIILIVGLFAIKFIIRASLKIMQKSGVDITLQKFLGNLIGWGLKILLIITRNRVNIRSNKIGQRI